MQSIETKYLGPTNNRGARITATCNGNKITIPYPYQLSGQAVHEAAALALCVKMGWEPKLTGGATRTGYVFVFNR